MSKSDIVEIYTDGACSGNPGPGGWGAILRYKEREEQFRGGVPETTNNRMEMTAVIEALKFINQRDLKKAYSLQVYTDSKYVTQGVEEWLAGWKAKNWKTAGKKPVKNQDLWKEIDTLIQILRKKHDISFHWVRGHDGHPENERADALARSAIPAR